MTASCCFQFKRKPDENSWSGGPVCGETNPARLYRIKRSYGTDKIVCDRDLAAAMGLWDWVEVVKSPAGTERG